MVRLRDVEIRQGSFGVTLLVLFAIGRGLCTGESLCKQSCQRNLLRDFFDDLQDSINTSNDDELQMFYRHFCGTKYNQTEPCAACDNSGSHEGLSHETEKRLFLGIREFVCDGDLRTWKGIQLGFSDPNTAGCWRLITTMRSLVDPLCNSELAESTSMCAPADDVENALLTLASTTAHLFSCTPNVDDVSSKQQSGQHLTSWRAPADCHYRRAINCIADFMTIYTSRIATAAKKKQQLKQAHADAICQWREGTCAAKYSVLDCTASQRAAVARFEGGISRGVALLCLGDASLLRNLSKTLHCWDLLKLNDCFNPSGLLTAPALFSARHTLQHCRDIEVKMIRCMDGALDNACGERPDVEGSGNLVRAFLSRADCGAASIQSTAGGGPAAAVLALPVAVATALAVRLS